MIKSIFKQLYIIIKSVLKQITITAIYIVIYTILWSFLIDTDFGKQHTGLIIFLGLFFIPSTIMVFKSIK